MRWLFATALLGGLLLALAAPALANGVARHDRPKVKQLKEGGKVVGFTLTLMLHPEGYARARIGLGKMKAPKNLTAPRRNYDKLRALAAGKAKGYLRLQFPEVTGFTTQPMEVSFQVLYGKKNNLKPGDKVDVVSAWWKPDRPEYFHVYGMFDGPVQQGDKVSVITLPGKK